jgi:hypothetical protein
MTNVSIKIVRPWPVEQPRPPVTHRTERIKASASDAADTQRLPRMKPL